MIVTQAVDRDDPNLGAFYYWFRMLGTRVDSLVIIAGRAGAQERGAPATGSMRSTSGNIGGGTADFPDTVAVATFEKQPGGIFGRVRRLWRFWALCSQHFADADAVLFHQIPEYVIAASPFVWGRVRRPQTALWYAHGAVSWRLALAERLVDDIFTSSEAGFRLPSKKVFYVGQAINTDMFREVRSQKAKVKSETLRMVSIGRISPVKHYETLIAACAMLTDILPMPWTFTIIGGPLTPGDRVYAEKLRSLVRDKGLEDRIYFAGERSFGEIPALLREHDMFLNASRTGSLDKAVLEAMACGLTAITSNEGYRTILPPEYFVTPARPEIFAEYIAARAAEERPNMSLRAIVVRDHALAGTIDRMAGLLARRV